MTALEQHTMTSWIFTIPICIVGDIIYMDSTGTILTPPYALHHSDSRFTPSENLTAEPGAHNNSGLGWTTTYETIHRH